MHENSEVILIIEDDLKLARLISTFLLKYGYRIERADNGRDGLALVEKLRPALIILDLMMPVMDGLSVCRKLQNRPDGKILVLTASADDMDHVAALEIGADDFVKKPIHPRVLLARVRSLLRRELSAGNEISNQKSNITQLQFGDLEIHLGRRSVTLAGSAVTLTEAEFQLLWLLASHSEQILSRNDICQKTRGIDYDGLDRSIDNRIVSLRRKLGDDSGLARHIITVRGKGYLFVPDHWCKEESND